MPSVRYIMTVLAMWVALVGFAAADPEPKQDSLPISSSELPWYRSFTLRSSDVATGAFMPLKRPDLEFRAGEQWGISIGLDQQDPLLESLDRMSAGAFYEFSPRFRLGGELSFVAPGDLRISTPVNSVLPLGSIEQPPVVRIESSIKF